MGLQCLLGRPRLIPQIPSRSIASVFCILVRGLWTKVRMPVLPLWLQGHVGKPSRRVCHVWPVPRF